MTWQRSLFFLAILTGAIFYFSLSVADAVKAVDVDVLLENEKSELEILKQRIEKQNKVISKADAQKKSLLRVMGDLEDQLKMRERELRIYKWNIDKNKEKISKLTDSMASADKLLVQQKMILGSRLRAIYKEGRMFPIKVLFSSDDFNDLLQKVKYMELVAAYDSALFEKYESHLKNLGDEKNTLLDARVKLLRFEENALEKQKEIQEQKSKKSEFLNKIGREKRYGEQIRKELVESSENLNLLIARLEEKLILGKGLDIADKKGRLDAPLKGSILNPFGKKRDKQYDTYIVYNGLNFKALKGTPVRAVFDGKVLYAGALEGYGNLIILGHGNEYHSLYGHLDEIYSSVGKVVRMGQIVGLSGDTGSLMGETLYFELRHKGKPINPADWFKRDK